jgi:hypothetical protein
MCVRLCMYMKSGYVELNSLINKSHKGLDRERVRDEEEVGKTIIAYSRKWLCSAKVRHDTLHRRIHYVFKAK